MAVVRLMISVCTHSADPRAPRFARNIWCTSTGLSARQDPHWNIYCWSPGSVVQIQNPSSESALRSNQFHSIRLDRTESTTRRVGGDKRRWVSTRTSADKRSQQSFPYCLGCLFKQGGCIRDRIHHGWGFRSKAWT